MANVDVEIAARRYTVTCRDGEEEHLRSVAAIVDGKAQDAAAALGSLSEVRQLLFASLLLADEIKDRRAGGAPPVEARPDPSVAEALDRLADRIERLAARLERGAPSA
ncbi:MAG: cell division protein ZapA [Alphaproteobacteria bacterium]|nr:cell division protein ZapA [Alphaproteobacteria bacterium]MBV9373226.1 cell division protein ZapA [Alphaproteobacteria bacterium]MBV9900614.1 cell division protein ZapA [Alphaproteobacteria bacterium]